MTKKRLALILTWKFAERPGFGRGSDHLGRVYIGTW